MALAKGYRSGLEDALSQQIAEAGLPVLYEKKKVEYVNPRVHRYTPDFELPNDIIIESKGRFLAADRTKHLLIKAQHPHLDIRFVFTRSATKLSKTSKTSYADWCDKHGFLYADKRIPQEWLR